MNSNDRNSYIPRPNKRMPVHKFKSKRKVPMGPIITAIVALIAIICVAAVIVVCIKNYSVTGGNDQTSTNETTNSPEVTTAPVTEAPETTEPQENDPAAPADPYGIEYSVSEKPWSTVKGGDLVLINSEYEYSFPAYSADKKIIGLYGNKSSSYVLRDISISLRTDVIKALDRMIDDFKAETGLGNIMVYNAYRSYEDQDVSYKNYVKNNGQEKADKYSALPGHSDYHSGASFELRYVVDGANYPLSSKPEYKWITDNMHKYGFILRYPTDKASVTGNDFEPFHFRYVGEVHATVMNDRELCLEEYLSFLKQFPYGGKHLNVTVSGTDYDIYYVSAKEGESIDLPLPTNYPYTVTGDNIGGVIVVTELK